MHCYPDGDGGIYQSDEQIPVLELFVSAVLVAVYQKRKLKTALIGPEIHNDVIVVVIDRYIAL